MLNIHHLDNNGSDRLRVRSKEYSDCVFDYSQLTIYIQTMPPNIW